MKKVIIVNATPLIRIALTSLVSSEYDWDIYGFYNIHEAERHILNANKDDIVLLDAQSWFDLRSIEKIKQWKTIESRNVSFILLVRAKSTQFTPFKLDGLSAFIALDDTIEEVVSVIKGIASHSRINQSKIAAKSFLKANELSPKQQSIAHLIIEGLSNKQIAYELGLSNGTVKSHITEIFRKLDCHRRTQIVAALKDC